ncbi:hypothetical protein BDQ17DRAFT_1349698 [Cyathus striatus]|nr:hypothetical protein BDQ17DRAFT_1349698 [Cyathus striatus]
MRGRRGDGRVYVPNTPARRSSGPTAQRHHTPTFHSRRSPQPLLLTQPLLVVDDAVNCRCCRHSHVSNSLNLFHHHHPSPPQSRRRQHVTQPPLLPLPQRRLAPSSLCLQDAPPLARMALTTRHLSPPPPSLAFSSTTTTAPPSTSLLPFFTRTIPLLARAASMAYHPNPSSSLFLVS